MQTDTGVPGTSTWRPGNPLLRAFFPDATIVASNLYGYHVNFCREIPGIDGIMSPEAIREADIGQQFDLIFCGSLLTHLPEPLF